jgi:hypothetical protein
MSTGSATKSGSDDGKKERKHDEQHDEEDDDEDDESDPSEASGSEGESSDGEGDEDEDEDANEAEESKDEDEDEDDDPEEEDEQVPARAITGGEPSRCLFAAAHRVAVHAPSSTFVGGGHVCSGHGGHGHRPECLTARTAVVTVSIPGNRVAVSTPSSSPAPAPAPAPAPTVVTHPKKPVLASASQTKSAGGHGRRWLCLNGGVDAGHPNTDSQAMLYDPDRHVTVWDGTYLGRWTKRIHGQRIFADLPAAPRVGGCSHGCSCVRPMASPAPSSTTTVTAAAVPAGSGGPSESEQSPWVELRDRTSTWLQPRFYYYHLISGQSTWVRPPGPIRCIPLPVGARQHRLFVWGDLIAFSAAIALLTVFATLFLVSLAASSSAPTSAGVPTMTRLPPTPASSPAAQSSDHVNEGGSGTSPQSGPMPPLPDPPSNNGRASDQSSSSVHVIAFVFYSGLVFLIAFCIGIQLTGIRRRRTRA